MGALLSSLFGQILSQVVFCALLRFVFAAVFFVVAASALQSKPPMRAHS